MHARQTRTSTRRSTPPRVLAALAALALWPLACSPAAPAAGPAKPAAAPPPASFFFNDTPTTEIYTLSLHDALPILSTVRLGRDITGCRNARELERRVPLRWLTSQTPKPSCSGPLKSSVLR